MKKLLVIGAMVLSAFVVTGCYTCSPGNGGTIPTTTTTEPQVHIEICPPYCGPGSNTDSVQQLEVDNALNACESVTIEHKLKPSLPDEVIGKDCN